MDWFSLMFGGGGRGWVEAALLTCLFWAALVRPERIRSPLEFRIASLLLALAIIAPVMVQLFVIGHPAPGGMRPPGITPDVGVTMYATAVPPLFLTLAVILGLDSVMPGSQGAGPN
jgi:hypothetical protein